SGAARSAACSSCARSDPRRRGIPAQHASGRGPLSGCGILSVARNHARLGVPGGGSPPRRWWGHGASGAGHAGGACGW
ncbi:MAG: hypothetical protein LAT68_17490, partial [Cyclobacteriaceae bacterium]|nr:hypothetical protein [Cyclobacteriaceae bacterium]